MTTPTSSTKTRLLGLLRHMSSTQPDTPVSLSEIARSLDVSRERVRQLYQQLAREYVLPPVKHSGGGVPQKTTPRLRNPKTLAFEAKVQAYNNQGMTAPEIAKRTGRGLTTIYAVFYRLHIPYNRAERTGRKFRNPTTLELDTFVGAYRAQGMTAPEIAGKIGRPVPTIYSVFRRLGTSEEDKRHVLEAEVRSYNNQDMTVAEIVKRTGRPVSSIYAVFYRLHIPFNRAKDTGRRLRNQKTLTLEAEVRKYSEQGLTAPEIAIQTGRNESTIQRIHRRLHIPLQPRRKSQETLALEAEVRSYSEQGLTAPEIARRTGRPERTIYNALHRLGIPRNLMGAAVHSGKSPETRALEAEVRTFIEQGKTVAEIAKRTGRPVQTIYNVFRRLGVPFTRALRQKNPVARALEAEVRKYSEQGLSAPEIAGKIGRPRTTIYGVLLRLHIPYNRAENIGWKLRNPTTLALDAAVGAYGAQGINAPEIAKKVGRPVNTIYTILRRLGILKRK